MANSDSNENLVANSSPYLQEDKPGHELEGEFRPDMSTPTEDLRKAPSARGLLTHMH